VNSWAEWNITPSGGHDEFLRDVIGTFLASWVPVSWHYFWEWGEDDNQDAEVCRVRLLGSRLLHQEFRIHLERPGIPDYYEGAHGKRGEVYAGEEGFYGKRVWEATYALWNAHAELALLLARQALDGTLERPRSMHWKRTAHLACNQLELPDVRMCLEQGRRYMTIFPQMTDRDVTPAESRILAELDKYLYPPDHI